MTSVDEAAIRAEVDKEIYPEDQIEQLTDVKFLREKLLVSVQNLKSLRIEYEDLESKCHVWWLYCAKLTLFNNDIRRLNYLL